MTPRRDDALRSLDLADGDVLMTQHTDALRSLDAATLRLGAAEEARAAATLERILATPPSSKAPQAEGPLAPRRPRLRLAVAAAAALAFVVGSVVVQGAGSDHAAYASWSASPSTVIGADLAVAADACRDILRRDNDPTIDGDLARLVLAERRGDHVVLLFRTEDPDMSAACFAKNPAGSRDVDVIALGVGGSTGPALAAPPRGYTQGAVMTSDGVSITDGAAGDDVARVVIHAGDLTVDATVENGRYAAWWPGPAFAPDPAGPSGEGGPELMLTYDLVLADGTVIRDAEPTLPK